MATVNDSAPTVESPQLICKGRYVFPPGLRFDLLFYSFSKFFKPGNPIPFFQHLQRYGRAAHYRVFGHDVVLFNHPSDIREILIGKAASFGKDRTQRRIKIVLGEGLITSDGETHKRARRIAAPAFHRQRIHAYADQISELAAAVSSQWEPGESLDIAAEMMRLALQIVARTLFDTEVTTEIREVNDQMNVIMDLYNYLIALPRAEALLDTPLPGMKRFRTAKARLDQVVDGMIAARQREPAARLAERGDLLSMLIAARDEEQGDVEDGPGAAFSPEELRDQVLTLFLAGFETVANALAWSWLLLGQNPEAEAKLHRELDDVLTGRLPTLEDLPRLEYTPMALAESMRLYPPVWTMARESLEEVSIGPYRLPKGTMTLFSQYIVQRDPQWFPDPTAFRPERHTPEAKAARPRFCYFPFGGGGRQCIGESFAWMEATLAIATIAQKWRLEILPGQQIEVQPKITLRPKYGIKAKAVQR